MENIDVLVELQDEMLGLSYMLDQEELKKHVIVIDNNNAEPEGLT